MFSEFFVTQMLRNDIQFAEVSVRDAIAMVIEEIFRSEDLLVRFVGGFSQSRMVVTFDCYNNTRSLDRKGFGESFFAQRSVDSIHVISKNNAWYQHPEMLAALHEIQKRTKAYGRVVTYGASMGAYGAIRFAASVNAQTAIAIAPQYSIDPAVCPFEARWSEAKLIKFIYDAGAKLEPVSDAIVFYDPYDVNDRKQIALIKADIAITEIQLPHAGHSAGIFLAELALLAESVIAIMNDDFSASEIALAARARRKEASKYYATLAKRAARRGHLNWAVSLAKTASAKNPTHGIYINNAAKLIAKTGDIGDAAFWQRRALSLYPDHIEFSIDLSDLLLRTDAYAEVIDICDRVLEKHPDEGMAHYHRAKSLLLCGRHGEALLAAQAAHRTNPDHVWFSDRITECENAIKASSL